MRTFCFYDILLPETDVYTKTHWKYAKRVLYTGHWNVVLVGLDLRESACRAQDITAVFPLDCAS